MATDQPATFDECCQAFADSYELSTLPAMQAVEEKVLGCDYGGTSWTTVDQVDAMQRFLALGPGDRLLDIGAGSGWPGLYLASAHGCHVTLVDMPLNALQLAVDRAVRDGIDTRIAAVAGSGSALPVASGAFAAISHSDVLCCLPEKIEMLAECRRVARPGARMAFTVIYIPAGLAARDHEVAVEVGPPFIAAEASYPSMLEQTGWGIESRSDVTFDHRLSLGRLIEGLEESRALAEHLGAEAIAESVDGRRRQIDAIDRGLTARDLYSVVAV